MEPTQIKTKDTEYSFKRYEEKYLLSPDMYAAFMDSAGGRLVPDEYFESRICSLYYDTDDYSLIINSLERPVYKEKLRVRIYGNQGRDGTAFVELKKKYKGVVYKRRVETTPERAEKWISGETPAPFDTQITREIDWFLKMNRVSPKMMISCDRISWKDRDDARLRFTFDRNILYRETELDLCLGAYGEPLLKEGYSLLEIKIPEAAPLWLASLLSNEDIFPTSYSKYGNAYTKKIMEEKELQESFNYDI